MKLWKTHLIKDKLGMSDGSGVWLEEGEITSPAQAVNEETFLDEDNPVDSLSDDAFTEIFRKRKNSE